MLLAALILLLLPGCRTGNRDAAARPRLRVTFLDVGQGDATVIESPTGRVIVVDGGGIPGTDERLGHDPGNYVVVPYLRSRGVSVVDLIVPTHPDEDHVQGLNAVVARMTVRAALDGGYPGESASYQRLITMLRRRHIPIHTARRGQRLDIGGGAFIEILAPPPPPPGDRAIIGAHSATNNNSVVLRVVYGKARFVLTGDAEIEEETEICATNANLSADVLKAGHHGSHWSSSDAFMARVHPAITVVSCGANNTYGHPHRETLKRFAERGVRVFRTDRDGAITIETDAERLWATPYRVRQQ